MTALLEGGQPLVPGDPTSSAQEKASLLASLDRLRVEGGCDCGTCPSLTFTYLPGEGKEKADEVESQGQRLLLSAATADGKALLLLHIRGQQLLELEVAPTEDAPVSLPTAADLTGLEACRDMDTYRKARQESEERTGKSFDSVDAFMADITDIS